MALTSRIALIGPPADEPEDYLAESLGTVFPDEVTCNHGDSAHSLQYTSPHLPKSLHIVLADATEECDRLLFAHYLWNASLLGAELVETGSLGLRLDQPVNLEVVEWKGDCDKVTPMGNRFDVRGKSIIELGAGTALPSIMAALTGARRVVATDCPSALIMDTLHRNITSNTATMFFPGTSLSDQPRIIEVAGHSWGDLGSTFAQSNQGAFDVVLACDTLWMPWQHSNLRRSIAWFLSKKNPHARAWLIAGFHTGKQKMRWFFCEDSLREDGLEVEFIWERDCDGQDRSWAPDQEFDCARKRWLVVAVLRSCLK